MHKWLAFTLFPRGDVRTVCNDELMILYAMVNKIKISPMKAMIKQWLMNFKMMGPIECTSLITHIASSMGVLDRNSISFIEDDRAFIDEAYLIYGHTLKKGPNDSLIFFSLGYVWQNQPELYQLKYARPRQRATLYFKRYNTIGLSGNVPINHRTQDPTRYLTRR
jgi:hypothetical protein